MLRRPHPRHRGARRAFAWSELRLMLLVGVLGGLAYAGLDSGKAGVPSGDATVRIVDGDTFWLGEDKIRIADIDTPEFRGRCPEERALAARATRRMETLLHAGPFELHTVDRDEDRYGRKLRVVTRDGRSLGDILVAEGLARTWTGRREPWCA